LWLSVRSNDDAKALVPLLDQLDKQMDALLVTLNGY
jgi:hypothetical protein